MNFNLFNSLILAGVIQGFLFAIVWLFNRKYRAKNTYFLIALIVVYSLSNLQFYLLDIGLFEPVAFYDLYYIPFSLLMPALIYQYGVGLMRNDNAAWKTKIWFFSPFIVIMVLALYYKYQLVVQAKPSGYSVFLDQIPSWGEYLAILYSIIVVLVLLFKIRRFEKETTYSHSKVKPQLKWFQTILVFNIFSISLWAYSEWMFGDSYDSYYFYPLWILLAVIIYWMGHVGIYRFGITQERQQLRQRTEDRFSISEVQTSKNELITAFEHYLIEESNYLNPNLSLESTAEALHISSGHLSKMINTELQQSFKDYVNNLRVEKAKTFLLDPEFSNYTLVAIGLEAGFNSKSAFNASFKKITSLTPSQFKLLHQN